MSSPLRILMVSARFTPQVGGTEIHTAKASAELVRRGHEVTVLTTDDTGALPPTETIDGVDVVRVRAKAWTGDAYYAPAMRDFMAAGSWDVIHIQGYHTAVAPLALRAAAAKPAATVLTFHSGGHQSHLRNAIRPLHSRLLRRRLASVDRLIGVSDFECDQFAGWLDLPPDRFVTIPNGTSFDPARLEILAQANHERSRSLIVSVGRFVRYKGQQLLVEAMPDIIKAVPDASLVLVGSGPDEEKLKTQIRRLGLGDRVSIEFVPTDRPERMAELLGTAAVACCLSSYESHGMAAHEALAAGAPLVVTDASALSEIVRDGRARPVPDGAKPAEVARIVADVMNNPDPSSAHPKVDVADLFTTWSSVVDRLEDEYHRLTAGVDGGGR